MTLSDTLFRRDGILGTEIGRLTARRIAHWMGEVWLPCGTPCCNFSSPNLIPTCWTTGSRLITRLSTHRRAARRTRKRCWFIDPLSMKTWPPFSDQSEWKKNEKVLELIRKLSGPLISGKQLLSPKQLHSGSVSSKPLTESHPKRNLSHPHPVWASTSILRYWILISLHLLLAWTTCLH